MKCLNCRGYDSLAKQVYIDRNGNILSESELTAFEILHPEEENAFYKKAILCGVCYEEIMGKTDRMFARLRATETKPRRVLPPSKSKMFKKSGVLAFLAFISGFVVYMSVLYWFGQKDSFQLEQTQHVGGSLVDKRETSYVWPDGSTYEGEIKNGKLHGKGTLTWANGDKYTGEFFEGAITGAGAIQFANGRSYVGEFLNGLPHGQGTMFYPDNTRIEGKWVNGVIE
ncbi:hypothetical protein [Sutcliffiella cohnii]|uniref:MORN repeat-containing protein n=1 Tax=Sutcliffiella cohnii TaxID=33932 RepID=UPI002E245644|nr:hypothetical protein [Sutcliffiella cohnii]